MSARPLTPEEAYVGSNLWLELDDARQAWAWVTEDDLSQPWLQLIHRLAGQLLDAGVRPDAVAVLTLAIDEEHATGENAIKVLTGHLTRLVDHQATAPGSCRWYAERTLDRSVRRRTAEMAVRIAQAAAGDRELDDVDALTRAEQAAVDAVRARYRSLTEPRGLVAVA